MSQSTIQMENSADLDYISKSPLETYKRTRVLQASQLVFYQKGLTIDLLSEIPSN